MVAIGREHGTEICLFTGPRAGWDIGVQATTGSGRVVSGSLRGCRQLRHAVDDVTHACALGVRSVLVSDLGHLAVLAALRRAGDLPADLVLKVSVSLPVANPATARVLEDLGADTLNLPVDLDVADIAEIRAATSLPLDVYIEGADDFGAPVRYHDLPEIVRVAAPVHVKFTVRNAPNTYPPEVTSRVSSRRWPRSASAALRSVSRSCIAAFPASGPRPGAVIRPPWRPEVHGRARHDARPGRDRGRTTHSSRVRGTCVRGCRLEARQDEQAEGHRPQDGREGPTPGRHRTCSGRIGEGGGAEDGASQAGGRRELPPAVRPDGREHGCGSDDDGGGPVNGPMVDVPGPVVLRRPARELAKALPACQSQNGAAATATTSIGHRTDHLRTTARGMRLRRTTRATVTARTTATGSGPRSRPRTQLARRATATIMSWTAAGAVARGLQVMARSAPATKKVNSTPQLASRGTTGVNSPGSGSPTDR